MGGDKNNIITWPDKAPTLLIVQVYSEGPRPNAFIPIKNPYGALSQKNTDSVGFPPERYVRPREQPF